MIPKEKRDPNQTYAKLLRELKANLRLDSKGLAALLGVPIDTLATWLNRPGLPRPPMRLKIEALATKKGLTIPE